MSTLRLLLTIDFHCNTLSVAYTLVICLWGVTIISEYVFFIFSNVFIYPYFKFNYLIFYLFGFRSSHRRCSVKKGVLRNFTKFTGKHLCQSLFFSKVAGHISFLLKKRLWHRRFPVNSVKFLRAPFLHNTSGRLLLYLWIVML